MEEFQVLRDFLSNLKASAENELFGITLEKEKPDERVAKVARLISARNVLEQVLTLPQWLKGMEESFERQKEMAQVAKTFGEGGTL